LKYDDVYWITGLILILIGQFLIIYSIMFEHRRLSLIGLIFLIVSLFIIGIENSISFGNVWIITILSIIPFFGLTTYYLVRNLKK
jgi:membrane-bound ClpP family serine protease